MRSTTRLLVSALCALALAGAGSLVAPLPASATVTRLCVGYSACQKAGMSSAGYAAARSTMYWRMYSGHNCTNYAAYRMVRSGLANVRPWSGGGNAIYWGTSMSSITDRTPAVGAVAWWRAGVSPAGASGHVAYVEEVVSADEIIVSQDSWGGDFSWARITRASSGWPSGFIHFNDVPLVNEARPAVTGPAKVGSRLRASAGVWEPGEVTTTYQWRVHGEEIAGATSRRLRVTEEMVGYRAQVRVTASQRGYPTTSVWSTKTPVIQPGVLVGTAAPTISGEPRVDETLTASAGSWNPAPESVSYQWTADGAAVPRADRPTLAVDPKLVGKALSVRVTAHKDGYADVTATAPPTTRVAPGVLEVTGSSTVKGTPRLGHELRLSSTPAAPGTTSQVQWLRAGRPVPGATGSTYVLSPADLGSRVAARVTLTREGYTSVALRSRPTTRVKTVPVLDVTTKQGPRRLRVTTTATADGVAALSGTVRVTSAGRLLAETPLRHGTATVLVGGLPSGEQRLRVVVRSSPTVARGVVTRVVTVRG